MEIADSGSWENSVISGHQLSIGFAMVYVLGEMSDQQAAGNVAIHKLPKGCHTSRYDAGEVGKGFWTVWTLGGMNNLPESRWLQDARVDVVEWCL